MMDITNAERLIRELFYRDGGNFYEVIDDDGIRKPAIKTRLIDTVYATKRDGHPEEIWEVRINRRLLDKCFRHKLRKEEEKSKILLNQIAEQNNILKRLQETGTLEKFVASVKPKAPDMDIVSFSSDDYLEEKEKVYDLIADKINIIDKQLQEIKYLLRYAPNKYNRYKRIIRTGGNKDPLVRKYIEDYEKDNITIKNSGE